MALEDFATQQIIQDRTAKNIADLDQAQVYRVPVIRKEVIALDNGFGPDVGQNPFAIKYAFKGVFVRAATDGNVNVNLALGDDSSFALGNSVQLFLNDRFNFGRLVASGAITAPKQPGKSITLYFIIDGDFNSGSQISVSAGGVGISEGTGLVTTPFAIAASTATPLFAQNLSRKVGTWVNDTGQTAYIGTSIVSNTGVNQGLPIAPGSTVTWKNTGALSVWVAAAVAQTVILEES